MKVLFLENHALWIYGLPNGFADAGHTAIISGSLTRDNIPLMIETFRPDLVVSMGWTDEHYAEKQRWIRDTVKASRIPLVYWATEDPLHTKKFTIPLLRTMQPDFVFTVTPSLYQVYERMGFKSAPLEFGYHSSVHHRIKPLDEYACDIAVVANAYPMYLLRKPHSYRMYSLKTLVFPLLEHGIRVDFWGDDWDAMGLFTNHIPRSWIHGYLDYPKANRVYSSAKMVIGPQNGRDQLTMRTYEILGSGGLLLTNDTPAIRQKYKPGRHLIVSSSPRETLAKVKYYLSHLHERERIRRNAQQVVYKDSYRQRAVRMVEVLAARGLIERPSYSGRGQVISYPQYIARHYVVHYIRKGETLSQIAESYGLPVEELMRHNRLTSDFIQVGDMLKIRER